MLEIKIPYRKQIDNPTSVSKRCGKRIADSTIENSKEFIKKANKFRRGY